VSAVSLHDALPVSPTKLNVNVWAGMSGSVAVAVKVNAVSSSIVADDGTPEMVGATLTSLTVTEIAASVFATPSDTRTEKLYEPGPWASVGVQVNAPLVASIDAPLGRKSVV